MARTRNPPKFPDYMILQEFIRRNIHYLDDTPTGFSYKKFCTTPKGMFHVKQFEFLKDESRTIAVSCSRRSGKTMGLLARMIDTALNSPDGLCLYICYTATQAYEIIWEPLKRVLNDFGLEFKEIIQRKQSRLKERDASFNWGESTREENSPNISARSTTSALSTSARSSPPVSLKIFSPASWAPQVGTSGISR